MMFLLIHKFSNLIHNSTRKSQVKYYRHTLTHLLLGFCPLHPMAPHPTLKYDSVTVTVKNIFALPC